MKNETILKNTILIIEDEPDLANLLKEYLNTDGYNTHVINDGLAAQAWIDENQPSLIVLDLMLPGKNGLEICKDVRKNSAVPIIMTTAKVEEIDRLLGLELGADDYICKPYSPREVVARVKTVLRRLDVNQDSQNQNAALTILLDADSLNISINKATIELTKIELNLFKLLYDEPGKIFSRQQILDNIYHDYRIVSDRTVDSHIKKLRKKLNDVAPNSDIIKSIYGMGYKFEPSIE